MPTLIDIMLVWLVVQVNIYVIILTSCRFGRRVLHGERADNKFEILDKLKYTSKPCKFYVISHSRLVIIW